MKKAKEKTRVVCMNCKKRLFDVDDGPETCGEIEIKCPRCGTVNCIHISHHKIRTEQTGA